MRYFTLAGMLLISYSQFAQNVGMGTPSPTERLHVAGTRRIEGNTTLNSNLVLTSGTLRITTTQLLTTPAIITASMAGLVPGLILNGTGSMSNLRLSSGNNTRTDYIDLRQEKIGNLVYHTINGRTGINNETQAMAISSSGNVGIGTDAPLFRLDLNGDLRIRSGGRFLLNTTAGQAGSVMVSGGSGASPIWSRRYGFRVGILEERLLASNSFNQLSFSTIGA
jgi:hypothetical protein